MLCLPEKPGANAPCPGEKKRPHLRPLRDRKKCCSVPADRPDIGQRFLSAVDRVGNALENAVNPEQGKDPSDGKNTADDIRDGTEDEQSEALLGMVFCKAVFRRQGKGQNEEHAQITQRSQSGIA